ncbi:hypothetical protein RN001_013426 [Aquatica leii]|uniref:Uncharacterized protein n=1 Tax=Aquatica leii TaxID=1421715 RepID=A0AAN7S718_9COLE|nr:hypothetical protein RN001_013426 [Aquatica leii]
MSLIGYIEQLNPKKSDDGKVCFCCGRKHDSDKCPAKEWEYFSCRKKGHINKVCKKGNVHNVEETHAGSSKGDSKSIFLDLGFLSNLDSNIKDTVKVNLVVEQKRVIFEIDSGACHVYPVRYDLRMLTRQNVSILGKAMVSVNFGSHNFNLPRVILRGNHKFSP